MLAYLVAGYSGLDANGDGIGDTPYVYIATDYANYSDNQPLMEPVPVIPEFPSWILLPIFSIATLSAILIRKKMFHQRHKKVQSILN